MIVDYWKKEREHFEQLCKRHGVKIEYIHKLINNPYIESCSFQAYAIPWESTVRIPDINSAANYTTALHELGHCVGAGGNPRDERYAGEHHNQYFSMPSVIKIELAAWKFAIENALPSVWDCEMAIDNAWSGYYSYYYGCYNDARRWGRKLVRPTSRNKYSQAILNKDAKVLASLSKLA